jgi:hypothetical protein
MLGFEAERVVRFIQFATFSSHTIQEAASVEFQAGLIGQDLQHTTALGIIQLGSKIQSDL